MFSSVEVGVSLIVNNLKALKQSSQVKDVRLSITEDDSPPDANIPALNTVFKEPTRHHRAERFLIQNDYNANRRRFTSGAVQQTLSCAPQCSNSPPVGAGRVGFCPKFTPTRRGEREDNLDSTRPVTNGSGRDTTEQFQGRVARTIHFLGSATL